MTKHKQRKLYRAACILSVVCVLYQIGLFAVELPQALTILQQHTATRLQIWLTCLLEAVHIAVAVLLAVTAFRFLRHRESERWLGVVAVLKALSFLLEMLSYHDGLPGRLVEMVCCVLLLVYALCCFHVIHRPSLLIPLETTLLIVGYCSGLLAVVQHMVFTTHASLGAVVLAAVCDPLSTVVMLLLAIGFHVVREE